LEQLTELRERAGDQRGRKTMGFWPFQGHNVALGLVFSSLDLSFPGSRLDCIRKWHKEQVK
jgi:hypothetical protein